ncbi:MAG: hypothetical protein RRY33_04065 [Alistipes sp.]
MIGWKTYLTCLLCLIAVDGKRVLGANISEPEALIVNENTEEKSVDPDYFLGGTKYYFFDDYLKITFEITKRRDIDLLSGILLQIDTNDGNQKILLLDWDKQSDYMEVLLINGKEIVKYKISDFVWADDNPTIPVSISLNFRQNTAEMEMNGDAVTIDNLDLSVNTGYRFSLLPALSLRPDPNIPPVLEISKLAILGPQEPTQKKIWYWLTAIIAIDLLIYFAVLLRRMRNRRRQSRDQGVAVSTSAPMMQPDSFSIEELPRRSAIHLFGGFYVYDATGEDISKQFSPLLRELLSLLVVYSADNGISSTQLKELLWFDKDIKSARNNRAVYLGKLRALLDKVGSYTLNNDTGYWLLSTPGIYVDYIEYKKMVCDAVPQEHQIELLLHVIQHGNLIPDSDYRWLDSYKAEVADTVIEHLCNYSKALQAEKASDFMITLADTILRFDQLNEQALYLKCKAYNSSGRHSSAKKTYDLFTQKYREIYGSNFQYEFTDVLNQKVGEASDA